MQKFRIVNSVDAYNRPGLTSLSLKSFPQSSDWGYIDFVSNITWPTSTEFRNIFDRTNMFEGRIWINFCFHLDVWCTLLELFLSMNYVSNLNLICYQPNLGLGVISISPKCLINTHGATFYRTYMFDTSYGRILIGKIWSEMLYG